MSPMLVPVPLVGAEAQTSDTFQPEDSGTDMADSLFIGALAIIVLVIAIWISVDGK